MHPPRQCIEGNSGCSISFVRNKEGKDIVRKFANDIDPTRLERQRKKHELFSKLLAGKISTPRIISVGDTFYEMEYFHGYDIPSFIDSSEPFYVLEFAKLLASLIEEMILKCDIEKVQISKFETKLDDLYFHTGDRVGIEKDEMISRISEQVKGVEIPVGFCHGDLTFSNILVGYSGDICIFDFLDSFYETPIQDMVKIRQDTKFMWSKEISHGAFDDTRYSIISSYIDGVFHKIFSKHDFYVSCYHPFQILNFFRILPYVEKGSRKDRLVKLAIQDLWREKWT
jgi:serine/threonine protein kinase